MKNAIKGAIVTFLFFLFLVFPQHEVNSSPESNVVSEWATEFGRELRELAEIMTKSKDLKQSYSRKARVEKKNGTVLMDSIVKSIGLMLDRKMDAVKCIVNKSEQYAFEFHEDQMAQENFSYYSSKLSDVNGYNLTILKQYTPNTDEEIAKGSYNPMFFDRDSHFFNLTVNTTHSSLHVPTNVYDHGPEASEFIQWSEVLDEVFTQNYRTDPALSWQYFGSNLGIMRHFPALAWNRNVTDTFDCRKRSWFIETATCSKDVVILLDNSGSMRGYRSYVAQLTIKFLLDTFSNNDFITVLNYSKTTEDLVPCFKDRLVQATPENIKFFNDRVDTLEPDGLANITVALKAAFKILEKYREERNCFDSASGCNQAIMLVTDGVPGNATEVFEEYNLLNSNETSPVRVFSLLLGKEVTKVREIQLYACLNRGYYAHLQSLDEVAEGVLKYVNVIAAPLVLQRIERPPTWTHAYIDRTYETDSEAMSDETDDFRLMIAVGVPAFNLSSYGDFNSTGRPKLLGVAGTDVALDDLVKLTLPYKIGVNGYSFIVSNNGYVLLHPDLRIYDKQQKQTVQNYNSIDFTEVEYIDDGRPPRDASDVLKEIRENLVNHTEGYILEVPVLFHYDERRRIAQTKQDYYFAPIPHTPFSLGIALPADYGNTWIKVGDVIKENKFTKINISDYFVGENWKIHPDWVYCKYHYLEGHEFDSPELELKEFLRKIFEPDWKWSEQYEADPEAETQQSDESQQNEQKQLNCGRKSLDDDAYYCNKELVELLVFDAKVTNESYQTWMFKNEREHEIVDMYGAQVRFIATMSGLTRWQFIFGEIEVDSDQEFGDFHSKAIEEPWYKSAILQHQIDKDSFVYSVPHQSDVKEGNETQVTASMAIFPRDGGQEAPSGVVGFQFSLDLMYKRFMDITSKVNCDDCIKTCGSDEQICYVIDNNGYIILSEDNSTDSGRFFGEVERGVMEVLVEKNVFRKLVLYDLQGLCVRIEDPNATDSATDLLNPFKALLFAFKWMLAELFIELSRIQFWVSAYPSDDVRTLDYDDGFEEEILITTTTKRPEGTTKKPFKPRKGLSAEDEEVLRAKEIMKKENKTIYYPCDKKSDLYVMQQDTLRGRTFTLDTATNGSRPFHAHGIPNSNLLLVVINKIESVADSYWFEGAMKTEAQVMETYSQYGVEFPCHKLYMNDLHRRRLTECFTEHPDEEATAYCGSADRTAQTIALMLLPLFAYLVRLM